MAITLVQYKVSNSASFSLDSSTGSGNLLVAAISSYTASGPSVSGITLGGSADNWASVTSAADTSTQTWIWYDESCAGGQTSINVSGSNLQLASGYGFVVIYEFANAGPLDQSSSNHSSNSTSYTSNSISTDTGGVAVVGLVTTGGGLVNVPGSPWTEEVNDGYDATGYEILSSGGSTSYSGDNGGAFSASIASFSSSGTDASTTPSAIASSTSMTAPAIVQGNTVSPSAVAAATSIPTPGIPQTDAILDLSAFDLSFAAGDLNIHSVQVDIVHHESSLTEIDSVTAQLYADGSPVGSAQTLTESLTDSTSSFTISSGIPGTSNLAVHIYAHGTTNGATVYVDSVYMTVVYDTVSIVSATPAAIACTTSVPTPFIFTQSGELAFASLISATIYVRQPFLADIVVSGYVGISDSVGVSGTWSSLSNAEGATSGDYASGAGVNT